MKTNSSIWRDISELPVTKNDRVKIAYITTIREDDISYQMIETITVRSYDFDCEKRWHLFCLENKIEKWTYFDNLMDL